ncbi:MAG TPA: amidohydrolase family protein [Burkholderiaceae bacterium]|nr:amidohydrolase family protein [Burkholderiaceae bacterium]
MIIDCHGHYTTAPRALDKYREHQLEAFPDLGRLAALKPPPISDEQIRETLLNGQLRVQDSRGVDVTLFSPRAAGMAHHAGDESTSIAWSRVCNDLIHRACTSFPSRFVPVCQLPQSPGVPPANCIPELVRCVEELGFVGCNLNPDACGGYWKDPPLTDRWWYPLYEKMVELDVPAMIHVSASCNPNFHTSGAHYLNGDTSAFMQVLLSDLFRDFPTLRFVIPHGGGAVPYHWGRFRGIALDAKRPSLEENLLGNVFFDTCVYHQRGIDLLTDVVPVDNLLFASETIGAVQGIDPLTGHHFDDTRRYIDAARGLTDADRRKIYEGNARRVYPRMNGWLATHGGR